MFTRQDALDLHIFAMIEAMKEADIDRPFRELSSSYEDEQTIKEQYSRAKKLHDQGYYLAHSDSSVAFDFPFKVKYPNGDLVPMERLESPVFVLEGGWVGTMQSYYGVAIVKKQRA